MTRVVFVAVLCASAAVPALADLGTVAVRETSMGPNLVMIIHSTDGATANNIAVYVGIQNLDVQQYGSSWPSIPGLRKGTLATFCVDIWDWSSSGYIPYDVVSLSATPDMHKSPDIPGPMGDLKARRLAELMDERWPMAGSLSNREAAALQAAIWEIVNEPDTAAYDVKAGSFYLAGGGLGSEQDLARSLANDWLHSISLGGVAYSGYLGLTSPSHYQPSQQSQDYIARVPIPAAVLLGMLGLGAAGLKLRKNVS